MPWWVGYGYCHSLTQTRTHLMDSSSCVEELNLVFCWRSGAGVSMASMGGRVASMTSRSWNGRLSVSMRWRSEDASRWHEVVWEYIIIQLFPLHLLSGTVLYITLTISKYIIVVAVADPDPSVIPARRYLMAQRHRLIIKWINLELTCDYFIIPVMHHAMHAVSVLK